MFSAPLTLLYKAQHLSRSQTLISVWRLLSRLTQANVWRAETESHAIPQFWSIWSLLKGYNRVRREAHSPVRSFLFAFAWSLAFALGSLQLLFSSFYPTKMPRKYPAAVASWSKARVASLPGESEINAIFRVYELEPSLSLFATFFKSARFYRARLRSILFRFQPTLCSPRSNGATRVTSSRCLLYLYLYVMPEQISLYYFLIQFFATSHLTPVPAFYFRYAACSFHPSLRCFFFHSSC